jgi:hypothetical protein
MVIVGFPGETMTDTSMRLQAETIGSKLITIDQVNGYHLYMTNEQAHEEGGYSAWASVVAPGAEPLLRRTALDLIRRTGEAS